MKTVASAVPGRPPAIPRDQKTGKAVKYRKLSALIKGLYIRVFERRGVDPRKVFYGALKVISIKLETATGTRSRLQSYRY